MRKVKVHELFKVTETVRKEGKEEGSYTPDQRHNTNSCNRVESTRDIQIQRPDWFTLGNILPTDPKQEQSSKRILQSVDAVGLNMKPCG